ncbi:MULTISPECIES: carbon-nitrogen hydrolase family protein [Corynebacterium]|uniref:Carbon-nitrogen hydrolase family protein n=1 Tax=Corynebacterium lipophilum TaxID=2804918 RepID=A0AAW5HU84_9CORY|nr:MULTISPECIES: carbon-nitrogen hydrolase family protein [Corynebacterium]MCO6394899.1 carbon-nitrogen hydrolase family protein [Corynebacterium lipophilum]MCZ2117576.1 carbon-nitrogen hydrolase family protein [Corynebacterium lipophilum]OIR43807.1 amidohydrolase [Corynebacterium sp. NML120713]
MRIVLAQFTSGPDKMRNLSRIEPQVREAARRGATLIVLPEAASHAFGAGRLDHQAEDTDGPFTQGLFSLAKELGVTIVAGSFRPADTVGSINRVYNTTLVLDGHSEHPLILTYDKVHLYDAHSYHESRTVKAGDTLLTFRHGDATIGVATCFDIRFPEQFKELAAMGAHVIVVPTSWADGPGKLEEWRLLTRARALDSGVFIAAAGQSRPNHETEAGEKSGPTGIGFSTLVAPDGRRIVEAGYGPELLDADIDISHVAAVQEDVPLIRLSETGPLRQSRM